LRSGNQQYSDAFCFRLETASSSLRPLFRRIFMSMSSPSSSTRVLAAARSTGSRATGSQSREPRSTSSQSTGSQSVASGATLQANLDRSAERAQSPEADDSAFRFLRSIREFASLSTPTLKALAAVSRLDSLMPGEQITNEGDAQQSHGFIVVSGCLSMFKTSSNGKELIVELLQAGDIFGVLLMLAGNRRPAELSARAIQSSKVLWIPITYLTQALAEHPVLFRDFAAHILVCLQSSYRLSRGLAHDRVEVRIAAVLSSLALKFGTMKSSSRVPILYFTRQQLADLSGTTPETAIRVTRAMQREDILDLKRPGIIRVLDILALNQRAES
jgi:CRP-like cAMP-binding protein